MRLRLRCSRTYSLGDLQCCMIAVPEKTRTVKDLAEHVASILDLRSHGGAEVPQLIIGGFLVPHDEVAASVFRDDEVVDVAPTLQHVAWVQQSMLALPASSGTAASKRSDPEAAIVDVNGASASSRKKARTAAPGAKDAPAMMALAWQSPAKPSAEQSHPKDDEEANAAKETAKAIPSKPRYLRHGSRVQPGGVSTALNVLRQEKQGGAAQSSDSDPEEERKLAASVGKALKKVDREPSQKQDAVSAAKSAALNACDALLQASGKNDAAASKASTGAEDSAPDARGIFVGGLAKGAGVDEAALNAFFSTYGKVEDVYVPRRDGEARGFAFVQFEKKESRDAALAAGEYLNFHGQQIQLKERTAKVGKNGKDGKGQGKGTDKGADKGKGKKGKEGKEGKEGKGKGKGKGAKTAPVATRPLEEDDDENDEEEEEEEPQKPAPKSAAAPKPAAKSKEKKADSPEYAPREEELEESGGVMGIVPQRWSKVQKQMAALGLPVSFVAGTEHPGEDEEEEEEDKNDEDDEEEDDDE